MTYENIKSDKKQDFTLYLEDTFLEKPQGGSQIDHLQFMSEIYELISSSRQNNMSWNKQPRKKTFSNEKKPLKIGKL